MFKRNLVAGALVWLPIWFTFIVVRFLLDLFDKIWVSIPVNYHPEVMFGIDIPGLSILVAAGIVWITGVLVTNFIGRYIIDFYESLLDRIPLVRSVYQTAKQTVSVIFSSKETAFSEVLLIEYPRKGMWGLAFKTNDGLAPACAVTQEEMVTVFVPTTPNPTSGFLLLVPVADTKVIDLSIEDALKYIVSLGTVYDVQNLQSSRDEN